MIKKKNDKSNLEKKRVLFFEMGIMIALATLLVAFESGTTEIETDIILADNSGDVYEEVFAPISKTEIKKPKPPMPPIEFEIIEENIDIDEFDIKWTSDIDVDGEFDPWIMEDTPEEYEETDFIVVETMPEYKGQNSSAFQKHLQQLVRYPEEAADAGISGTVYLQFVVDKNGNIIKENVIKSPHPSLSDAVLVALKKTKRWKAGEQRGRKVNVSFTVPVVFRLN